MENQEHSKKIVLVVEDNPEILKLYEQAFTAAGFQTLIAHDGEEAFKLIQDKIPDCVILDILMPKMDGIEVLSKMRNYELIKSIPVLVLTNYDSYNEQTRELGATDYLIKADVTLKDILERVQNIIKK